LAALYNPDDQLRVNTRCKRLFISSAELHGTQQASGIQERRCLCSRQIYGHHFCNCYFLWSFAVHSSAKYSIAN